MTKARDLANAGTALTTVSATELGYLDGVTSAVQTQINSKIGQSTAINPTIVDAKGDIVAATAADTVARLAVGANNTVLTADSSAATGLKWSAPASSSGPAFNAYRAFPTPGHQSISNGVSTKLGFTNEFFDTANCFDSTTNYRFTPNVAGYYQLNLTVGNSSCTGRTVDFFKNGVQDVRPAAGAISGDSTLSGGVVMYFNGTTDYVEAYIYLVGSSLLAYGSVSGMSFSGVWIRS